MTQPLLRASTERDHHAQVAILGAGPVGLSLANYLARQGVQVLVIEKLDQLIDYPRAIGIDDEALRTIQALGLIDDVLPHTTPHHAMRFLTPRGRCFAHIQPMTDEFGFSRRNAFVQPQVDAILLRGLKRYAHAQVLFSRNVDGLEQDDAGVTLHMQGPDGTPESVRADWLLACDGGASYVRRTLNIGFDGSTAPNQWIVVDIANDPLGTPHVYLCCDPVRPYVSAALPHGIRRFEFMVMPGETEEQLSQPENMRQLLAKVLPNPQGPVDLIRQRVYTHNARLAERFRQGRVLLAGDAAHIMPVWQGQGYNSGMRDAFNLGWKLALVVQGKSSPALLDTYQQERRDHAKAMIDLSVTAGHVLAPPHRWQGMLRDGLAWLVDYLPPVKRYFLEMRFKPMPRYHTGAMVPRPDLKDSPIGRMFIQPKVLTEEGHQVLLDEVIGNRFAVIGWGTNPLWGLSEAQRQWWQALGTCFMQVVPDVQMHAETAPIPDVQRVGDIDNRIRHWFARWPASVAILRPDRFVAALCLPQTMGEATGQMQQVLFAHAPQPDASAATPDTPPRT